MFIGQTFYAATSAAGSVDSTAEDTNIMPSISDVTSSMNQYELYKEMNTLAAEMSKSDNWDKSTVIACLNKCRHGFQSLSDLSRAIISRLDTGYSVKSQITNLQMLMQAFKHHFKIQVARQHSPEALTLKLEAILKLLTHYRHYQFENAHNINAADQSKIHTNYCTLQSTLEGYRDDIMDTLHDLVKYNNKNTTTILWIYDYNNNITAKLDFSDVFSKMQEILDTKYYYEGAHEQLILAVDKILKSFMINKKDFLSKRHNLITKLNTIVNYDIENSTNRMSNIYTIYTIIEDIFQQISNEYSYTQDFDTKILSALDALFANTTIELIRILQSINDKVQDEDYKPILDYINNADNSSTSLMARMYQYITNQIPNVTMPTGDNQVTQSRSAAQTALMSTHAKSIYASILEFRSKVSSLVNTISSTQNSFIAAYDQYNVEHNDRKVKYLDLPFLHYDRLEQSPAGLTAEQKRFFKIILRLTTKAGLAGTEFSIRKDLPQNLLILLAAKKLNDKIIMNNVIHGTGANNTTIMFMDRNGYITNTRLTNDQTNIIKQNVYELVDKAANVVNAAYHIDNLHDISSRVKEYFAGELLRLFPIHDAATSNV